MNLAVVIPAYNHLAEVLTCLNSLKATASASRVYHVSDDCSPEVDYPAVMPPSIASVSRNPVNLGFAGNCNAGSREVIQRYNPDVIFFLNQDVYAVPEWSQGWDEALLKPFEEDASVGIVGARLLFPNGAIQNAGGVFDTACQPVHRCLGYSNPNAALCGSPGSVQWTTGAALAIRASLFQQLGGFDERYERAYFEDCDLCLRAREAGFHVVYQPGCTLIHTVGSTGGSPYFVKNALRFKKQWVDTGKVQPGRLMQTVRYW